MKITTTRLRGVMLLTPDVFTDERGALMETWSRHQLGSAGLDADFSLEIESLSKQWVLRGLHFQVQRPQGKLVRVSSGQIFDVAVDLRRSSPTFGQWIGEILSDENHQMLWIPAGFAHGYLVLSAMASVLYKMTDRHVASDERCIAWDDPDLAIRWPLHANSSPILSERDRNAPLMSNSEHFS